MTKNSTATLLENSIAPAGFSDPNTSGQWYFSRPAQSDMSIEIETVWEDYTGTGVKVGVMDTQVRFDHADISRAYDESLDVDLASGETELDWDTATYQNYHGTAVAGVIAAENGNGIGGQGIADGVTLVGLAMDFTTSDAVGMLNRGFEEAAKLDVVNCSWGYTQAFSDRLTPNSSQALSLETAISEGRGGLGTAIVFSGGNSGSSQSSNYHNYQNSVYTIAVASVDKEGEVSSFSSLGSNLLISAGGEDILTTSAYGNVAYTSGTSFSAPMVTAAVALILEANPELGYRDVQQILALSARADKLGTDARVGLGWVENGATNVNGGGMHFSDSFGYGYLNVNDAVRLAETWNSQNTFDNLLTHSVKETFSDVVLTAGEQDRVEVSFEVAEDITLEQATIAMDFIWQHSNDLEVFLTSPDGTVSQLVYDFVKEGGGGAFRNFTFTTEALRGESAAGTWTLEIVNTNPDALKLNKQDVMSAALKSLTFTAYGSEASADDVFVFNDEFWNGFLDDDASREKLSDTDGGTDTLNASMVTTSVVIDLSGATASSIGGRSIVLTDAAIENLYSGDGDDQLTGSAADNVIGAGRGDDTVLGSLGNDTLHGGAGSDTLVFDMASSAITAIALLNPLTITLGWAMGADSGVCVISDFETFAFEDSVFDLAELLNFEIATPLDPVVVIPEPDPVTEDPTTEPVSGDPTSDIPDDLNAISGTVEEEKILGTSDSDFVNAGAGDDSVVALDGDDYVLAGSGNDTLFGAAGEDTLHGNEGDDLLIGATEGDLIFGDDGNDKLFGGDGNDWLEGGTGDDKLFGGLGEDTLLGGEGNDTLTANDGATTLSGDSGSDKYFCADDEDTIILLAERGVMNRVFSYDAEHDALEVQFAEGLSGELAFEETAGGTYLGFNDGETTEYFAFFTQTEASYLAEGLGL
ncbi:S8 family serine peptidase [Sagittula sp. SSi028]|uniref:S8 family serine peptidase n=1 Tax=Sagittula sp. SSi028 TaxID=3400636 RepID=UPI003AF52CC9